MIYYLDNEYRVHCDYHAEYLPWEDSREFFAGKCKEFIEGYRVVPEGSVWTDEDGETYSGLTIAPYEEYLVLNRYQRIYEKEKLTANREVMDVAGAMLTDEQAVLVPTLYREWSNTTSYTVGDRCVYNNTLYRCLTSHTAQQSWNPEESPSLWTKVLIPDESIIPEWEQPESTNPYMVGDKVAHNGQNWISTVDNNTWEPGVYGWDVVEE